MSKKTKLEDFISSFKEAYKDQVESAEIMNNVRVSILVKKEYFIEVAKGLRDEYGAVIPVSGGAIDYPEENRIQMMYYLNSPEARFIIIYRVNLNREEPVLPSLTQIWEAMSFHEREAHEMFGIDFTDHPNLVPLLLPPDWKGGYPLRKDFKGEGIE